MGEQLAMQPGQLTKPMRVWCSSTSIRVAWYQAQPVSDSVTIFYKKSGALFGTEIVIPTATILGPDLSIRQPGTGGPGESEYFELELRKLRPSTQYVIKVRSEDGRWGVRSERLSTLSVEEERTRNSEMANFVGSLIKLGDYDGTVLSFDPNTGLYQVRILQVDDVAAATQLVRFASEYSELGLGAHAYTLSAIKFGRWGGEIRGSRVVGEGELRWIVARAVQLEERSDLAAGYDARERVLQGECERLTSALDAERAAAAAGLRVTRLTYRVAAGVIAVLALLVCTAAWGQVRAARRAAAASGAAAAAEVEDMRAQLYRLEMYRVSLELDAARWFSEAVGRGARAPGTGTHEADGADMTGMGRWAGAHSVNNSGTHALMPPLAHLLAFQEVTEEQGAGEECDADSEVGSCQGANCSAKQQEAGSGVGGRGSSRGGRSRQASGPPVGEPAADAPAYNDLVKSGSLAAASGHEPPHPWTYVHHAATLYATYLQEWLKHQLSQSIRARVNDMLLTQDAQAAEGAGGVGGAGGGTKRTRRGASPGAEEGGTQTSAPAASSGKVGTQGADRSSPVAVAPEDIQWAEGAHA